MLAVLANVTNTPASNGGIKTVKIYPPWHNKSLTKDMYFKLEKHDHMVRQLEERNKMCKEAEATNKQLRLEMDELFQSRSRVESELAQERVDHEQKRSQDAHLIKELRKALREVRDIVRAFSASTRGDPPSVTNKHRAAKKRARVDDDATTDPIPPLDRDELLDADFLATLAASMKDVEGSTSTSSSGSAP